MTTSYQHFQTVLRLAEQSTETEYRKTMTSARETGLSAFTEEQTAAIWDYAHNKSAATLRSFTGRTRKSFCQEYAIPLRTVEAWDSESDSRRSAPPYLLDLLAFAVISSLTLETAADQ